MKLLLYQGRHLVLLLALLLALQSIVIAYPECLEGSLFGVTTFWWLLIAVLSPIIHQVYVAFVWRLELYYKGFTKFFGKNAFRVYKVGFAILILTRVATILLVAISNRNSMEIEGPIAYGLTLLFLIISGYLFYSVFKYFGIDRAFGIDHFQPEEARHWPLVKQGIFQYSENGMYLFGFLALYIPGLLLASKAALLIALFNHLYIWVHFYFTELPDMREIYGEQL